MGPDSPRWIYIFQIPFVIRRDEQRLSDVNHHHQPDALHRGRRADGRLPRHGHTHHAPPGRYTRNRCAAEVTIRSSVFSSTAKSLAPPQCVRSISRHGTPPSRARCTASIVAADTVLLGGERRSIQIERDQFDLCMFFFPLYFSIPIQDTAADNKCKSRKGSNICSCYFPVSRLFFDTRENKQIQPRRS